MMNMKVNNVLNQLRQKQPQQYQVLQQMIQSNGNPMNLLKQVVGGYTPEQLQNFYTTAQRMGVPNDILSQIQNQLK